MNRYIDADKTLDMMWNALYQYEDDMEKKNGLNLTERLDVQNGFEVAHKVVVDAPTADVVPVVHAHWNKRGEEWAFPYDCSNCGHGSNKRYPYCHICGAKMDGKEGKE